MKNKYELVIQSNINELINVQNFIEGICDNYNIDNYFGLLSIAIMEAAENAIKHGNQLNASKIVTIECAKIEGGISVKVTDEGNGFNHENFNTLSEDEKGEGIFLMRALTNQLNFLENGKTVELIFFIDGIDSARTIERTSCMQKYFQKQEVSVQKNQTHKI